MGVNRKAIKSMFSKWKWKILRGDKVVITAGRDKGQSGIVKKVIRDEKIPRVIVEGRNLSKRAIKRTDDHPGGFISVESPLHYSNVMLADPVTGGPVRTTWRYLEDGTKVRITKGKFASGSVVPRPEILKQRKTPKALPGPKDTSAGLAEKETDTPGDYPTVLKELYTAIEFPAAAQKHYSTAAHPSGYREQRLPGLRGLQQRLGGSMGHLWRGFAAAAFS